MLGCMRCALANLPTGTEFSPEFVQAIRNREHKGSCVSWHTPCLSKGGRLLTAKFRITFWKEMEHVSLTHAADDPTMLLRQRIAGCNGAFRCRCLAGGVRR